jgi:hypothetical protein
MLVFQSNALLIHCLQELEIAKSNNQSLKIIKQDSIQKLRVKGIK